jgi:hypothetical protein
MQIYLVKRSYYNENVIYDVPRNRYSKQGNKINFEYVLSLYWLRGSGPLNTEQHSCHQEQQETQTCANVYTRVFLHILLKLYSREPVRLGAHTKVGCTIARVDNVCASLPASKGALSCIL